MAKRPQFQHKTARLHAGGPALAHVLAAKEKTCQTEQLRGDGCG
jgi:hypothetical protein